MQGLLVLLPESTGGLFPIAVGLFHSDPTVRKCAVNILQNVKKYQSTMTAFQSLNPFLLDAFEWQLQKDKDGTLDVEIAAVKEREKQLKSWKEKLKHQQQQQELPQTGGGKDGRLTNDLFDDEDGSADGFSTGARRHSQVGSSSPWSSPGGSSSNSGGGGGEGTPISSILRKTLNMITAPSDYDGKFSPSLDNLDLLP